MNRIKKALLWCLMLTKRLYKKVTFVIILALIPITVLAFGKASQEDSGIMTILLVQEDPNDALASQVVEELLGSSDLILFKKIDNAQEAERIVQIEKADAAWIFPKDMEEKILDFVTTENLPKSFVRVVVREENVTIKLANEKLSGALFKYCARTYYRYYMRMNAEFLDKLSDEEILYYYDSAQITDHLFDYCDMYSNNGEKKSTSSNYLVSPMRGLLGVIIVLCGLATALYYIHDDQNGTFSWLELRMKPYVEMGYQLISAINISVVILLSLGILGVSVSIGREVLLLILYAFACSSFCQMIRIWCKSSHIVGTAIPVLTVLMIAVCPIFYDLSILRWMQFALPPTYFVNAAYNPNYIWYMIIYTMICQVVSWLCRAIFKRV